MLENFEPRLINEAELAPLTRFKIKSMRLYFKSIKRIKKALRMVDKVTVVKLSTGAIIVTYHFEDKKVLKTLSPVQ